MPLIGSVIVVVAVAAVGLLAWSLLPKAYDKTVNHFNLEKEELKVVETENEVCEGSCENCSCKSK